ncbi:phosphatase PAP2 family protein [Geomonas sp. RF6]|uniref:phosphatase PAP2 family protein n=1 Tax=Geomonas sp. RF6 TaxID=2897342 RepID=UPI001E36FE51|nr:phosphatase PAP2 family protein [Geomonas sp. RF6]UFS70560.1 phosphatase PAP2 family protein [Geomonas sp. RF6]
MRRVCCVVIAAVVLCSASLTPASAASHHEVLAGDVLLAVVPAAAIGIAFYKDDVEGEKQWLRNMVANQALTSVLRLGFNQTGLGERPNGHPYGFPSGHIAFAGAGASFLQERYGWSYGVPAWLATGYIAYVRVDNNKHHWYDVVAAAGLAYGVGKLFVTPENATHVAPVIGPEFIGLRLQRSW